jgi:hypothetical protein
MIPMQVWEVLPRTNYWNLDIVIWQGVAMDFTKYHSGPPCLTILPPAGGPPLKQPYGRFWNDPPTERAASGRYIPPWTPRAIRLNAMNLKTKYSLWVQAFLFCFFVFVVFIKGQGVGEV